MTSYLFVGHWVNNVSVAVELFNV